MSKTILITGATSGFGKGAALELARRGHHIIAGVRSDEKAEVLKAEAHDAGIDLEPIILDITNPDHRQAAFARQIDILVNNAGIMETGPVGEIPLELVRRNYETNVFGVVRVTQAFVDLLKKSPEPRIVNVSTAMASLSLAADPSAPGYDYKLAVYQSSKSALNMYTVNLAHALRDTNFKVNAVCPGYTKTDFTNYQGTSTVEEAGQRIAKYALIGQDGPNGKFISEEYFPEPASCPW